MKALAFSSILVSFLRINICDNAIRLRLSKDVYSKSKDNTTWPKENSLRYLKRNSRLLIFYRLLSLLVEKLELLEGVYSLDEGNVTFGIVPPKKKLLRHRKENSPLGLIQKESDGLVMVGSSLRSNYLCCTLLLIWAEFYGWGPAAAVKPNLFGVCLYSILGFIWGKFSRLE